MTGPHAVVVDFGVAKAISAATNPGASLTSHGVALGTPAYMSPEQATADPTTDHRADLYSVAAVGYEMLTGQQLFSARSSQAMVAAHVTEIPEPVTKRRATVPPLLAELIMRALEKRAADRPQSAAEMLAQLEAAVTPSGTTTPYIGAVQRTPTRNRALYLTVGAIALMAGTAAILLARRTDQPLLDQRRVLVAEFTNETGDPGLASLGRVTADWIAQGLAQSGLVEVVPSVTAMRTARSMDIALEAPAAVLNRALAEETGAGILVSGAYYREADSLIIHARITDPTTGRILRGLDQVSALATEPMRAVERTRQRTLGALASITDSRLSAWAATASQPPSFEAYQLYAEGLDHFFRFDDDGFRAAAIRFRQAAALDSSFTAPLIWAAFAYGNVGEWAAVDSITRILERHRKSLAPWDRAILDYHQANVRGDRLSAYHAARRVAVLTPQSEWRFLHGASAIAVNRPREAIETLGQIDPDRGWIRTWPPYWRVLNGAQHMVGDHRAELESARLGRARHPTEPILVTAELRALVWLGRVKESVAFAEAVARAGTNGISAPWIYLVLANELSKHGDSVSGVRAAERGITNYEKLAADARARPELAFIGAALFGRANRWEDAYRASAPSVQSISLPPGRWRTGFQPVGGLGLLGLHGVTAAKTGRREEALRIASTLEGLDRPYLFGSNTFWRAVIFANLGERERAVQLLRQALAEGTQFNFLHFQNLALDPLKNYRPYQELIRPKG